MTPVIRFRFNRSDPGLTWEEYEAIEMAQEGELKLRRMRPLVARFMIDEQGGSIPHKQALDILGKLPLEEVKDVFTKFAEALQDTAVPKASGNSLNSPSEATPPSGFPGGSQP
jgi:hypothetical protein